MNIFCLDRDPAIAAQSLCDKHTVKMVLETAQLLCAAVRIMGVEYGYKITHQNHPCSKWTRATNGNFNWLRLLGIEIAKEYSYRYGKVHKCESIITNVPTGIMPKGELTPFIQAMPEEFKYKDPVQAYRNYYRGAKANLLVYTKREPPEWIADIAKRKNERQHSQYK